VERALEEALAGVERGTGHGPARVVHHDVEAAELLDGGVDEVLEGAGVVHIGRHHEGPAARPGHPGRDLLEVRDGAGGEHHIGSGLGQADGDAPPDPLARPGDDGNPVVEAEAVEDHCAPPPLRDSSGAARPATSGISR
jgi:hypothetical protein